MSAHNFQPVYDDLGINLKTLGCVMLGTETPDTSFIEDEDLYYANDPSLFWVKGRASGNSHITLKYGLLNSVRRRHVDTVIRDLPLPEYLVPDGIEIFASPYPDEPYECVVLRIRTDPAGELMNLHNHLNYLPHINTFPDYKAHITLGYVKAGWFDGHAEELSQYPSVSVRTTVLDYGDML